MRPKTLCPVLAAGLLAFGNPSTSRAQGRQGDPPPAVAGVNSQQEAMQRFQRGVDLYEEGDYAASLIEFRKAYELAPSYKLLHKIGQVSYKMRDYAGALKAYQRYLREGGDAISTERQAQVQEEVNLLKSQTGYIEVSANVFGAFVSIDDAPVGTTPLEEPVLVSVGKRRISVTAEGRVPFAQVVNVAGQERTRVNVNLQDLVGESRTVIPGDRPSKMTTASWVGVIGAGVLGIGATVTGILATNESDNLSNRTYVGTTPSSDIKDQQSKVDNLALTTDILAGAALVTLGTTLILTFTRPGPAAERDHPAPTAKRPAVQPVLGLGTVGVQGEF